MSKIRGSPKRQSRRSFRPAAAVSARIAIDADGKSWAVWQDAATNQIRFSVRDPIGGEWRPETLLSESGQVCASLALHPRALAGGSRNEVREGR